MPILIIILISCLIGAFYCKQKVKYYNKLGIRNNKVHDFRVYVIRNHPDYYDSLPSYDEMLYDKKELTIDNYIPSLMSKINQQ